MGVQNKDIRINWDSEPRLTNHLVNLIAANSRYSACIFGNNTGDRWLIERELCLEVLKQEPWMRDKEVQGWVRRSANGWEATDKWTSGMVHPVRNRLHLLVKRMKEGWYKSKYAIDPEWTREEQVPEVTRGMSLLVLHSVLFYSSLPLAQEPTSHNHYYSGHCSVFT